MPTLHLVELVRLSRRYNPRISRSQEPEQLASVCWTRPEGVFLVPTAASIVYFLLSLCPTQYSSHLALKRVNRTVTAATFSPTDRPFYKPKTQPFGPNA